MTREEFQSNAIALAGSALGWQGEIARRLGVRADTIRKAMRDGPSDSLAAALFGLIGEPVPAAVMARWICGDGDDGREYLVHTRYPRMMCTVLTDGDGHDLAGDESGAYHCGDGVWLANIHWIDQRPDALALFMDGAANALESFNG